MAKNKEILNIEILLSRNEGLFPMKELSEYIMQTGIESEVTKLIGAKSYERAEERSNQKNG